eukprot:1031092-Prymnesium_polylepis.1
MSTRSKTQEARLLSHTKAYFGTGYFFGTVERRTWLLRAVRSSIPPSPSRGPLRRWTSSGL